MRGSIATFTELDMDGSWFNVETRKAAEAGDTPSIDDKLRPNYRSFNFELDPALHLVVVETHNGSGSLTPGLAEKFFNGLFASEAIIERFGEVKITVLPDKETLRTILSAKNLRSLRISISRPNPDDTEQAEAKLKARLDKLNVKRMEEDFYASGKEGITPDEPLKQLAKIAQRNGFVSATMKEGDAKTVQISTRDHPSQEEEEYGKKESPGFAFERLVSRLLSTERQKRQRRNHKRPRSN